MGRVIGVISGKGGVGKTTTAVNLAASLSYDFGKDVVVVDTNVNSSNLSLHVGAHFHPLTINDVLRGEAKIDETLVHHPSGMKVVPASLSVDDLFTEVKKLPDVVNELKAKHELVILDTAPSVSQETVQALRACDAVIVVTTPNLPSVTDALKTIKLAEKLGVQILGVVLNMNKKKAPLTISDVEYMTNHKVLSIIPYDDNVDVSVMKKVPIVHFKPKSKVSQGFKTTAAKILGVDYKPEKNLIEKVLGLFIEE